MANKTKHIWLTLKEIIWSLIIPAGTTFSIHQTGINFINTHNFDGIMQNVVSGVSILIGLIAIVLPISFSNCANSKRIKWHFAGEPGKRFKNILLWLFATGIATVVIGVIAQFASLYTKTWLYDNVFLGFAFCGTAFLVSVWKSMRLLCDLMINFLTDEHPDATRA